MKIIISSDITVNTAMLANNIRKERIAAGFKSTEEVAKALGVTRPTYSKYEDPETVGKASIDTLLELAKLFGCKAEYFFMG